MGVKKACMFGTGVNEWGTRACYCSADSGAVLAVDRYVRAVSVWKSLKLKARNLNLTQVNQRKDVQRNGQKILHSCLFYLACPNCYDCFLCSALMIRGIFSTQSTHWGWYCKVIWNCLYENGYITNAAVTAFTCLTKQPAIWLSHWKRTFLPNSTEGKKQRKQKISTNSLILFWAVSASHCA